MMVRIVDRKTMKTVAWIAVDDEKEAQAAFDGYVESAGGDRSGYFYIVEQ